MEENENNVHKNKVLEELGIYNPGEEPKAATTNSGAGKKRILLPLILILLVTVSLAYIAYDEFQEYTAEKEIEIFEQGIQYASNEIALALFDEALTCAIIPISNGSLEINLIATKCLTAPSIQ